MESEIFAADGYEEYRHVLFPGASSVTGKEVIGLVSGATLRIGAEKGDGELGVLVQVMVESPLPEQRDGVGECLPDGFGLREVWVPWEEFGRSAAFVEFPVAVSGHNSWYGNPRYIAARETRLWKRAVNDSGG